MSFQPRLKFGSIHQNKLVIPYVASKPFKLEPILNPPTSASKVTINQVLKSSLWTTVAEQPVWGSTIFTPAISITGDSQREMTGHKNKMQKLQLISVSRQESEYSKKITNLQLTHMKIMDSIIQYTVFINFIIHLEYKILLCTLFIIIYIIPLFTVH